MNTAKWIWLPEKDYPAFQKTKHTVFDKREVPFLLVRFRKEFCPGAPISKVTLLASGDCRFRLYANGSFLGMGPAFPGGDWARTETMPQRYADRYSLSGTGSSLLLEAEVQLPPSLLCDISDGKGGFYLDGTMELEAGEILTICTDDTWQCSPDFRWKSDLCYNASVSSEEWGFAETAERTLPLPSEIPPCEYQVISIPPTGELDKIYTGTLCADIETDEPCVIRLIPFETRDLEDDAEEITCSSSMHYEGFRIRSVGGIRVEVLSGHPAIRNLCVRASFFPGALEGQCITGDSRLNLVMQTCEHTLLICRQSIHLDSPRHMEPLGCTGDYTIESLMEYYCFSDHRLTRFDIVRTARLLEATGGVMFHTGYSLMWISMLKDYILYTGDQSVLPECENAIRTLLAKFQSYEDEDGILDRPPNYMFADWVEIAGCSMHHPPKALGQTLLNALYYRALHTASRLLNSEAYYFRAEKLKSAFRAAFWDDKAQLFISGRTDSTGTNEWLPENIPDVVFTLHANAMAVACGVCEGKTARAVMLKILSDTSLPDYQPYFAHFVFLALWKAGLFGDLAMPLFRRWVPMVEKCSKGLAEGWIPPCDGYVFDHSHAWGGCPRYWLPRALIGLDILEPGFRVIRLSPRLKTPEPSLITVPTPYGHLTCEVCNGKIKNAAAPKEITVLFGDAAL